MKRRKDGKEIQIANEKKRQEKSIKKAKAKSLKEQKKLKQKAKKTECEEEMPLLLQISQVIKGYFPDFMELLNGIDDPRDRKGDY